MSSSCLGSSSADTVGALCDFADLSVSSVDALALLVRSIGASVTVEGVLVSVCCTDNSSGHAVAVLHFSLALFWPGHVLNQH